MLEMLLSLDFVKNLLKEHGFVKLEEEVETSKSKLEELLDLGSLQTKLNFKKDKFTIYVTFDPLLEDYYKEATKILYSDNLEQDIDVMRLLKKCNDHRLLIRKYPESNGTDTLEVLGYTDFSSFIESGIISDLTLDKIVVNEKFDTSEPFNIISDFTIKIHCNVSYADRKWYSSKRVIDDEKDSK